MGVLISLGVDRLIALMLERHHDDDISPTEALKNFYLNLNRGKELDVRDELEDAIAERLQAAGWKLSGDGNSFVRSDSEDE
jgi:hypothetical protein